MVCTGCFEDKKLDEFYDAPILGNKESKCKKCRLARVRQLNHTPARRAKDAERSRIRWATRMQDPVYAAHQKERNRKKYERKKARLQKESV